MFELLIQEARHVHLASVLTVRLDRQYAHFKDFPDTEQALQASYRSPLVLRKYNSQSSYPSIKQFLDVWFPPVFFDAFGL